MQAPKSSKPKVLKFSIDLTTAVKDKVIDAGDYVSASANIAALATRKSQTSNGCSPRAGSFFRTPRFFLQAKYITEHLKVNNKLNNLGESVTVAKEGSAKVTVTSNIPMAKRYLKYLTKRYLKKQNVRDYLRVLATSKNGYELKYFKVAGEADE